MKAHARHATRRRATLPVSPVIVALAAMTLFLVSPTAAQWPTDSVYAVADFGAAGNRLKGFDDPHVGPPNPDLPIPGAASPDSICMCEANDVLLIADTDRVHRYDLAAGAFLPAVVLPAAFTPITWLDVDEDCGVVWCTSTGNVYHRPSLTAGAIALVAAGLGTLNAIAWDGSRGGYAVARYGNGAADGVYFLRRSGAVIGFANVTYVTGLDWDPRFPACIIGSRFAPAGGPGFNLFRAWPGGSVGYLPGSPFTQTANSVEVVENPQTAGVPFTARRFVGVEYGASPTHIYKKSPDGAAPMALYIAPAAGFGPSDLEVVRSRQVWAKNTWTWGAPGHLSVNFGPLHAGATYVAALSLGHAPGIALGASHLHLNPDWLFVLSLFGGPSFSNFAGVLDAQGRANPSPWVALPPPPPAAMRIYAGAIVFSSGAVKEVSNCFGVTPN